MNNYRFGNPDNELYLIGEVSKMSKISKRALRYYETLGLIKPDKIGENGYRYYSYDTILKIPIINYLKLMDYSLEEMLSILSAKQCNILINSFEESLIKCEIEMEKLKNRHQVTKDWQQQMIEACTLLSNQEAQISTKYLDSVELLKMDYNFDYDYSKAILNLDFTNFVDKKDNVISGPVMIFYPSMRERLENEENKKPLKVEMVQKSLRQPSKDCLHVRKPGIYISGYHIGKHENISDTYNKMMVWAKKHEYEIQDICYERFLTDYWTSLDSENYVTEILIPVKKICLRKNCSKRR